MFWSLLWIALELGRHPRRGRGDRWREALVPQLPETRGVGGRALRIGCGYSRKVGSVFAQAEKDREDSHSISHVPLGWGLVPQL